MEFLSYEDIELAEVLARIPRKGRDRMQFGIIELDLAGIIVAYNMGEAKITGRNASDMIGKNFFSDIAPCTQTPEFYGRFKAGVQKGNFSARFDYLFNHEMNPVAVRVSMMMNTIENENRVLLLIRLLPPEERERAEKDKDRLRDVEQKRRERDGAQALEPIMATGPHAALALTEPKRAALVAQTMTVPTPPVAASLPDLDGASFKPSLAAPKAARAQALTIAALEDIAFGRAAFELPEALIARMERSVAALDKALAEGVSVYGVTSGFGPLSNEAANTDAVAHQRGLLRHLASGVGKPFSVAQTRAALIARLQTLLQGYSGASEALLRLLKRALDEGITPIVPQMGTVGASGDLTPLAHVALALAGEGDVMIGRQQRSAQGVMSERGILALSLERRDALALVNGCAFASGIAALNGARARRLLRWTTVMASAYSQVLLGFHESLAPVLSKIRPHIGQMTVRAELARLCKGSTRMKSSPDVGTPPQDVYSVRCQSQLFGAVLDTLDHHDTTVEIELNSVSDNPIIDPDSGQVVHGGNFFGQHVGFASDYLRMSLIQWAQWLERAMARLVDPALSPKAGLEPQLRGRERQSGFMGAQVTMSALFAEVRSMATPASVQGSSTNSNNQDIVPLATIAARQTSDALDILANMAGILALALSQAMDLIERSSNETLASSAKQSAEQLGFAPAAVALRAKVRELVPMLRDDRSMGGEISTIAGLLSQKEPAGDAEIHMF
jgi:tyrosine ammonia-lyase